jgi:membrane-associated protease RseP (regulator of RpoE activity)
MRGWRIHAGLLALTVVTTLAAGAYMQGYDLFRDFPAYILPGLWKGVSFSIPLIVILGSHEMSHYINSRKHGVDATLPYFIPFPNVFGTLGAVIKIKSPIMDRNALVDIGSSGPLVGFMFSVLACAVGLALSSVVPEHELGPGEFTLGPSLLYYAMIRIFTGADLVTHSVDLHPIAVAGWVGLFVTSINLMPVGQLDGGHISYAFFRRRHKLVSRLFVGVLTAMGIFLFPGWLIWAVLLLIIGTGHPPVMDPYTPLEPSRRLAGLASLIVFIITFPPIPIQINM